jgi:transcriptional regulator with XRE-family HTH domain
MATQCIPVYGSRQYPYKDFFFTQNPEMDITQTIAKNLQAWMRDSRDLQTIKALANKSGVGFGTAQRARNGIGNTTIQNLDAIAKTFGRHVADLIQSEPIEYPQASPPQKLIVSEPLPSDVRMLVQGFNDASPELRDALLNLAQLATCKRGSPGCGEDPATTPGCAVHAKI